jgi:hypothetical protein
VWQRQYRIFSIFCWRVFFAAASCWGARPSLRSESLAGMGMTLGAWCGGLASERGSRTGTGTRTNSQARLTHGTSKIHKPPANVNTQNCVFFDFLNFCTKKRASPPIMESEALFAIPKTCVQVLFFRLQTRILACFLHTL